MIFLAVINQSVTYPTVQHSADYKSNVGWGWNCWCPRTNGIVLMGPERTFMLVPQHSSIGNQLSTDLSRRENSSVDMLVQSCCWATTVQGIESGCCWQQDQGLFIISSSFSIPFTDYFTVTVRNREERREKSESFLGMAVQKDKRVRVRDSHSPKNVNVPVPRFQPIDYLLLEPLGTDLSSFSFNNPLSSCNNPKNKNKNRG